MPRTTSARLTEDEIEECARSIARQGGFELSAGGSRWFNSAETTTTSINIIDLLAAEEAWDLKAAAPMLMDEPATHEIILPALTITRFHLVQRLRSLFIKFTPAHDSAYVQMSDQAKQIVTQALSMLPRTGSPIPEDKEPTLSELQAIYAWHALFKWATLASNTPSPIALNPTQSAALKVCAASVLGDVLHGNSEAGQRAQTIAFRNKVMAEAPLDAGGATDLLKLGEHKLAEQLVAAGRMAESNARIPTFILSNISPTIAFLPTLNWLVTPEDGFQPQLPFSIPYFERLKDSHQLMGELSKLFGVKLERGVFSERHPQPHEALKIILNRAIAMHLKPESLVRITKIAILTYKLFFIIDRMDSEKELLEAKLSWLLTKSAQESDVEMVSSLDQWVGHLLQETSDWIRWDTDKVEGEITAPAKNFINQHFRKQTEGRELLEIASIQADIGINLARARSFLSTAETKVAAIVAARAQPLREETAKKIAAQLVINMQVMMQAGASQADIIAELKKITDSLPSVILPIFNEAVLVNWRQHIIDKLSGFLGLNLVDPAPANSSGLVAGSVQLITRMLCDIVDKIPGCAPYLADALVMCLLDTHILNIIGKGDYLPSCRTVIHGISHDISDALNEMGEKLKAAMGAQNLADLPTTQETRAFLENLKPIPIHERRATYGLAFTIVAAGAAVTTSALTLPLAAAATAAATFVAETPATWYAAGSAAAAAISVPLAVRQFFGMSTAQSSAIEIESAIPDLAPDQYRDMAAQFSIYLRTVIAIQSKYFTVQTPAIATPIATRVPEPDPLRAAAAAADSPSATLLASAAAPTPTAAWNPLSFLWTSTNATTATTADESPKND